MFLTLDKPPSIHRCKILGIMAVMGAMLFVLLMTQFYSTDRHSTVDFTLPSLFKDTFVIEGTTLPTRTLNKKTSPGDYVYAIVFDAGSTGSRAHIFKFLSSPGHPVSLLNETFLHVKPGLSAYAHDPLMAALSLQDMLRMCTKMVPASQQASTPLVLKATAGLRLLKEGEADNILNEVTANFKKWPFRLPFDAVGIMDGVDEGVFSWITVNFMLGLLGGNEKPLAALDLGGGSTQITFVPQEQSTLKLVPESYMKTVKLFSKEYHLYTHSYLNFGLMSARFTLTGGDQHADDDPNSFVLTSPCIPAGYSGNYTYGDQVFHLRGPSVEEYRFESCLYSTQGLVKPVLPVEELSGQDVYIFSYFFDRAKDAGLIGSSGGTATVGDFKAAAQKVFKQADKRHPWLALDLAYIYSLLSTGYHISDSTSVHLKKKIADVEVSWALGAAFEVLTEEGLLR
ncbi:ectonucleoside triphosphate diphosphohydrolase 5-like isoform X2 [Dreissena polymorpha]|uniref:Uncharacterized protein n=1 Tax=Dreissena polymorpha TaxID=45954 RepID=A0A9D4L004_DREPO|nr:ectonucleoside triphosphate diphosphohydrolase 5-like isoform X2 [Dreissena polymorpha]KAH3848006.1 hypothetical protein DPMN_090342 [Dreissena polymorpha]